MGICKIQVVRTPTYAAWEHAEVYKFDVSIAQNLSRICSNGLFFRKFLLRHFRGLRLGFRALHSA